MRTTLTLDPDTVALLRRRMADTGGSLKVVVNEAIRAGLTHDRPGRNEPYRLAPRDLGEPSVPVLRTLRLAADIEDEEIARKLAVGR